MDDFYSLLSVAFYFVFDTLPWRSYTNEYFEKRKNLHCNKKGVYIKIRWKLGEKFDQELIENGKELQ